MKVSIARVRLILKTGKTLADGSHPIVLMVAFNGKSTRSTGYSCDIRHWDKRAECVRKGYPNYQMINYEINRMKQEVISLRNDFERLGQLYTPEMILSPRRVLNAATGDLNGLIRQYIDEKGLMGKTIEKWWGVYRSVVRFHGRELNVVEIDESFCRRYGRWCESEGLSNGSIRSYLGKIGAICHYAIGKGLLGEYPFKNWKYHRQYREAKSELYVHHRSMDVMIDMLVNELVVRNGERWSYRNGVIKELMDIHSEIYSHYLFVITYWLCGISPVDLSMLRKSDIKVVNVKGRNYYAIDGYRSKTGVMFKVRVLQNCIESQVLVRTMLMFGGERFVPTLEGYVGKDERKRVNNVYSYHSDNLVNWFQMVNQEIVRRNMESGDEIPLIDLSCRYYAARHSYIMKEIQSGNVNLLRLATSVGKSVVTLHQYVTLLNDEDLV